MLVMNKNANIWDYPAKPTSGFSNLLTTMGTDRHAQHKFTVFYRRIIEDDLAGKETPD
jgi:hypothetical protein